MRFKYVGIDNNYVILVKKNKWTSGSLFHFLLKDIFLLEGSLLTSDE